MTNYIQRNNSKDCCLQILKARKQQNDIFKVPKKKTVNLATSKNILRNFKGFIKFAVCIVEAFYRRRVNIRKRQLRIVCGLEDQIKNIAQFIVIPFWKYRHKSVPVGNQEGSEDIKKGPTVLIHTCRDKRTAKREKSRRG